MKKTEKCNSQAEIVKGVPLVRGFVYYVRYRRGVYAYVRQDGRFGVAKCELKKGHEGRHRTSRVTDFFKTIEWR